MNEKVDEAIKEAESELQTGGSSSTPSAGNIKAALESLKQGRLLLAEHPYYATPTTRCRALLTKTHPCTGPVAWILSCLSRCLDPFLPVTTADG